MYDYFSIRVSMEFMAKRFESGLDFLEVINFTIEDNSNGTVFTRHRLVATYKIDDCEPAHSKRDSLVNQHSLVIRTAMRNDSTHPRKDHLTVRYYTSVTIPKINESCNTTHLESEFL